MCVCVCVFLRVCVRVCAWESTSLQNEGTSSQGIDRLRLWTFSGAVVVAMCDLCCRLVFCGRGCPLKVVPPLGICCLVLWLVMSGYFFSAEVAQTQVEEDILGYVFPCRFPAA